MKTHMSNRSIIMHVLAAALLALLPAMAGAQPPSSPARTVQVVGQGKVSTRPDLARVSVGVVTEAETAAQAMASNNRAVEQLMGVLSRAGIEAKDMQTVRFSVTPQYARERRPAQRGKQQIIGYQVSNSLRVTVRKLDALGTILDEAVQAGANQVQGVSFGSSQENSLLDQARVAAVGEAKRKAQLYAAAADVQLGRLLLISEQAPQVPRPEVFAGTRLTMASAVPVAPGELELTATIHLTYAINK